MRLSPLFGNIDIVLRRSHDRGKTWSDLQLVADHGSDTIGNPTPVVLPKAGTILLLLTANPAKANQMRTVWITSMAKKPERGWYTTGPGNGIELKDGRIVILCDHTVKPSKTMHSHVIYSDDGSLLLNMRADHNLAGIAKKRRAVAVSKDRGVTSSDLTWDETLVEPVCQARIVRYDVRRRTVLFSNPAHDVKRMRMTMSLSFDDAATWPTARVAHQGPASYSSLAVLRDRTIGLL